MLTPGELHLEVLVYDYGKFTKWWISTPSPQPPPAIKIIKQAGYNQKLHAGIAVSGFGIDSSSNVDFVIGIEVVDPNGTVILKNDRFAVHQGQFNGKLEVIRSHTLLDMAFGPGDPAGVYKINATVSDNIANKRAAGSTRLTIKP